MVIVKIINNSSFAIPAISLTTNPFRLSWRFTDLNGNPVGAFKSRKDLVVDVPARSSLSMEIVLSPPKEEGEYYLEVTALQEEIAWFHETWLSIPRSKDVIVVSGENSIRIEN